MCQGLWKKLCSAFRADKLILINSMRVAIIGAGAAGLMSAATINENNPEVEVFLLEKNFEIGKKIILSGGGRCNVTTGLENINEILKKYPRGGKFLQSALRHFSPVDVKEWFETHGVPLKCEKDLRVFPVSNDSQDIVKVFNKIFSVAKTKILFNHSVAKINKVKDEFVIEFKNQDSLTVDKVILAMGGQSYRQTGSTGDGYSLAESFGHQITSLVPSLSSFITLEKWPSSLAGLAFAKAKISVKNNKQQTFTGPFIFTHTGLSGPAVFALSSIMAFEKFDTKNPLTITIDLIPDISTEDLLINIKKFIMEFPKKSFKNTLHTLVPLSLAEVICQELSIPLEKKNAETNKQLVNNAVCWLKQLPLTIVSRGAGEEFVTAGGVELTEVNPRTMESKICLGLFFAGEILNIDGFTGGFNLQASWSTGRVAGESVGDN